MDKATWVRGVWVEVMSIYHRDASETEKFVLLGELYDKAREDTLLQVRDMKVALATVVGEAANLDEAVLVARRALEVGTEKPKGD